MTESQQTNHKMDGKAITRQDSKLENITEEVLQTAYKFIYMILSTC